MFLHKLLAYKAPAILSAAFIGLFYTASAQVVSIQAARQLPEGSTVTVRGIVTNGAELGVIRYLQDATAGIAAFPGAGSVDDFAALVKTGDSIEVSGTTLYYNGLLEISPVTAFSILAQNRPLPAPVPLSVHDISAEYESRLVELDCVDFQSSSPTFNTSGTYTIADMEGLTARVYLRGGHPLIGADIPEGSVRLRGILSRFNEFQLLPRSAADFGAATCFYFVESPQQSNLSTNGFRLRWETSVPAACVVRYGSSPALGDTAQVAGIQTENAYLFGNLQAGVIYWAQVEATYNGLVRRSPVVPYATRSLSSGAIRTYFNKGIDPAFADGYQPDGETYEAVLQATLHRIDSATQTLDVAMYNNNRSDLVDALQAAQARGVRVRYVAALDASNPALNPPPAFPVLFGNEDAIMHNKFMVIDADLPQKAWVMSGAMNWTNQNMTHDFNNVLFIQDQSLARAYELEFEEMWGSSGAQPDPAEARFGAQKTDNTPHRFLIADHAVECYFSPTDQTTFHIQNALAEGQFEALFATFSFTKNELGNAVIERHASGVPVRGIMENISDSGAEYTHLLNNGVNVRHHSISGEFHHKYAVLDAYEGNSDPTVVTGSHNWSNAAETANDENTLVLHHPALAALYKAEFEKRWAELPSVGVSRPENPLSVFPNPAENNLSVRGLPAAEGVWLIKNSLGQVIHHERCMSFDGTAQLSLERLPAGPYFLTLVHAHGVVGISFQKI
jgi:phosphatidylserine/phosphatidylglycerophosphate/cardiolipin synthase-like enzyme